MSGLRSKTFLIFLSLTGFKYICCLAICSLYTLVALYVSCNFIFNFFLPEHPKWSTESRSGGESPAVGIPSTQNETSGAFGARSGHQGALGVGGRAVGL